LSPGKRLEADTQATLMPVSDARRHDAPRKGDGLTPALFTCHDDASPSLMDIAC
jgi:hypothetical protein